MRIAYICADPGVPVFGRKGSSVHVQEVIGAMTRAGAEVTLFANRFDGNPPADLDGVEIVHLPRPPKGDPASREQRALDANDDLRAALQQTGPFDLIYERYSLWSFAGMEFAHTSATPSVLEVNAPLIEEQATHRDLVNRAGAEQVARSAFGLATSLVAVSEQVAAYLRTYPGAGDRVHVIPNGVNPGRFPETIEPALEIDPETFAVGFVGTLKRWHGLPVLVEAFDRLLQKAPDARLLIVGDGDGRGAIEAELAARGLDTFAHFTGAVAPEAVPSYLAAMDVGVAPYPNMREFYFSPLKVFEYMAAGLPVVASDIGQIGEFVDNESTGLLCPPGDAGALASALAGLRNDPGRRRRLGQAARAYVLQHHTWDRIVDRIFAFAGAGSALRQPAGIGH